MSFPGTYNINYYKGDTFEFRIYPKDANGTAFPLNTFTSAKFSIATERGSSTIIEGYAALSNDNLYIQCAITPAISAQLLTANSPYVYDVEIGRDAEPYDIVYTVLTGTITLTEQVTPLTDIQPSETQAPTNPTNLTATVTNNSITATWTEPTGGGTPDGYKLYIIPYTLDAGTIAAAFAAPPTDTIAAPATSYTYTGLDGETDYLVGIMAYNAVGDAPSETILNNLLTGPITTEPDLPNNPTDLVAAAIDANTIGASWTAPTTGGTPSQYKVYIMPYTTDPTQIALGFAAGPADTISATNTQYAFTGLTGETSYLIAIQSSNVTGDASLETVLSNLLTGPITTPPEGS